MNVKRIAAGTIAGVMLASTLCGCSEASRVRRNLNQEADNFNIQRRCKGLLDYQRRWCPEWITYGMVADAWGARVQTRQLRRYDK